MSLEVRVNKDLGYHFSDLVRCPNRLKEACAIISKRICLNPKRRFHAIISFG